MKIGILGGGSTAYACAADLVLRGHNVRMFSQRPEELEPIRTGGGIKVSGILSGFAPMDTSFPEIGDVLNWAEIVLLTISAGGFETYAHLVAQHAATEQRIVSFGKGGVSLIMARIAREHGNRTQLVLAEGNSALYLCRRLDDNEVWIGHITREVVTAAFPSQETASTLDILRELFPSHGFSQAAHVVETILYDYNALLHPGPMICNASRVERSDADFGLFSEETVTPAVVNIVRALDQERLALCSAMEIEADSLEEEFWRQGYARQGTSLLECFHTDILGRLKGPFALEERHLSEDVPFGLVAWCSLAQLLGVATPVSHACAVIASTLNQEDYFANGASLEKLGLDPSWDSNQLRRYLNEGLV